MKNLKDFGSLEGFHQVNVWGKSFLDAGENFIVKKSELERISRLAEGTSPSERRALALKRLGVSTPPESDPVPARVSDPVPAGETTAVPGVADRVYRNLVLTDTQKKEIEKLFASNVEVDVESGTEGESAENPKPETVTMTYTKYLTEYNTPLVALREAGQQADLNFFVAVVAGNGFDYTDRDLDNLPANLQDSVDIVFRKLKGFEGFPINVVVNIFGIAISKGVTYTGSMRPIVYSSEQELADASEMCYFGNDSDCSATRLEDGLKNHHHLIVWSPVAPLGGSSDHSLVYSTVYPTTTLTDYIKIVMSMTGAVFMCGHEDKFDTASAEDAAFLKASCKRKTGPNGEMHVPLSDMDHAILRQIWLLAQE